MKKLIKYCVIFACALKIGLVTSSTSADYYFNPKDYDYDSSIYQTEDPATHQKEQYEYVYQNEEEPSTNHDEATPQEIDDTLNKITLEYSKVSQRNGKFMFVDMMTTQQKPPVQYKKAQSNAINQNYDFIVVGSGSAGAALANRLSENPRWKILLLEAGKPPSKIMDIPGICAAFQLTEYNWGHLMEKQPNISLGLEGQRMAWPRGRALGGTSTINYMIHVRGNRRDYDRWAAMGNPGWSYKDVLPYFQKLEDASVQYADFSLRNRGGPVGVQDIPFRSEATHAFIRSCMEAGYQYVDYNGAEQLGVSYVQGTLRRGFRASAENSYLRPIRDRPNLTIITEARVTKVTIDENQRVTGVEYVRNRRYNTATVTKEVILSAGTFHSPQLLMLSGIGPKAHLQEMGIPLVMDLPVGEKMYDHSTFLGLTFITNGSLSFNPFDLLSISAVRQLFQRGQGPLTMLGGVEALTYIKTNMSRDPDPKYPDVELIFIGGSFANDRGLVFRRTFRVSDRVYNAFWKPLESISTRTWTVFPMLVHPKSVGQVKLKSKNPMHLPRLFGNFYTDPENFDIKTYIAAIREVQRINQSPTFQKFGSRLVDTKIPGCEYFTWDTDDYWECAIRHITGTLHHQVATAKMGPADDPESVVDPRLRVYGIKGLRVADCSIIPLPLTAHTNIPAMMVGEKAADLIKEDWARVAHDKVSPVLY